VDHKKRAERKERILTRWRSLRYDIEKRIGIYCAFIFPRGLLKTTLQNEKNRSHYQTFQT
ncbi:MAG: hypothetical protein AAF357_07590, partial [Verrucomicrobiota bacterium]